MLLRAGVRIEGSRHSLADHRRRLLAAHATDLVLDVGAAEGQYGVALRQSGYHGPLLSVEPRASSFQVLSDRSHADPTWNCLQVALAPETDERRLHTTAGGHSSSLLRPVSTYDELDVREVVGSELVVCRRLDSLPAVSDARAMHVKVDVQGAELAVIESAEHVMANIASWEVELSFVQLYDGQPLIEDVIAVLRGLGYAPTVFERGYTRSSDARVLQVDALFTREPDV